MSNASLLGKASAIPTLVSFSAKHTRSLFLATTNADVAAPAAANAAAPAAPPPTDTTSIPGVALMQAIQGFVDGLTLSSFDATLSTARRAAVLNSLLFAQLAANGDVQNDPTKSLAAQTLSYLPVCGFTVLRQSSATYNAGGLTVSLDKALLDCLQQIATDLTSIDIMKDVVDSLETLPNNNGALTLFDHNSINNGHATVATTTVTEPNGAAGDLELTITIFDFAFSSSDTRVLWIKIDDAHSQLNYSTVTLSLQDDAYAAVSSGINNQISQFRNSSISNVTLKRLGA